VEDFSDVSASDFVYWSEAVNNFHETGKFEYPPNDEVINYPAEQEISSGSKGCTAAQGRVGIFFLTGLIGMVSRRSII